MEEIEKIEIAKRAIDKGWDYEQLFYSGEIKDEDEELLDDIWDYVIECREIGTFVFYQKYGN